MRVEAVKQGDRKVLPYKKKKGTADGWGLQTIADDGLLVTLEPSDSNAVVLTKATLSSFGFYYRKPKEKAVEVVEAPVPSRRKRSNSSK
jgi:hypothetical protein